LLGAEITAQRRLQQPVDCVTGAGQAAIDAEIKNCSEQGRPQLAPSTRMNMLAPVAAPRSSQPTLVWIETRKAGAQKPMPRPITNEAATAQTIPLDGCNSASKTAAATSSAPPMITDARYETRIMTRAAAKVPNVQLTDWHPSAKPAMVGLRRITPWT